MRKLVISSALLLVCAGSAMGQMSLGNVAVLRVGDGTAALGSGATAGFIHEFLPSTANQGSAVSTISLPTTGSGSMTFSGTATSEGMLTASVNGQYLTAYGYGANVGTASITSSASATINRVVGRIDWAVGTADTSTRLTNTNSAGNARGATSLDGTQFWTYGSTAGVWYASSLGATTGTQINSASPVNLRTVNIFGGQLYASTGSGTVGLYTVGSGTPTTGFVTPALLFATGAGSSPYDYVLFGLDAGGLIQNGTVAYVADDRALGSGGGVQRWNYNGTSWSLAYTLGTGLTSGGTAATVGARGLAGSVDVNGIVTLFATTAESNANRLIRIDDSLANVNNTGATFTTLATAPANTAFRGVEVLIPTPGAAALLGFGVLTAARRRRA